MPIVAWYMLSKESYMNRVIRDVFPTAVYDQPPKALSRFTVSNVPLCSPRNTNLFFSQPYDFRVAGANPYLNFFKGLL